MSALPLQPSTYQNITSDILLKSLVTCSDFMGLENKNWDAIARLFPGTSAMQCARRYEELVTGTGWTALQHPSKTPCSSSGISLTGSESSEHSTGNGRPGSGKNRGNQDKKVKSGSKDGPQNSNLGHEGPTMVIHVCDEAKNLKKDFHCPRDLLVKEMKYFAEYLSTDAQRWDEVDISVHCNVHIFDWLMKYVKRGTKEVTEEPKLEPNNVISILISSDFLKMESLVSECISFCYKNMNMIVATPCNMDCINDRLLTRISDLFNHNEADSIKDRKDKFKSKLFSKKVEKLFDPEAISIDSAEKATTLFRCSICKRLLTHMLQAKVKCMPSRMTFGHNGLMTYSHMPDPMFDVNDYILELKSKLKTWRDVYWHLWGTINYLSCSRCTEIFPLTEFSQCSYHKEQARYDAEPGFPDSCSGTYPCCGQRALRFNPVLVIKGCHVKDHLVKLSGDDDNDKSSKPLSQSTYDDLLVRKDIICLSHQPSVDISVVQAEVFANETFACHSQAFDLASLNAAAPEESKQTNKPRLQALTVEKEISYYVDDFGAESDDEIGDDETQSISAASSGRKAGRALKKSWVTVEPQAILIDAPGFEQTKKSTWDVQRSLRYNQDAQRQEDARRMKEIRLFLTKLRLTTEKVEKPKKEYAGGIYSKLEGQWKMSMTQTQGKQPQLPLSRPRMKPPGQSKPSLG